MKNFQFVFLIILIAFSCQPQAANERNSTVSVISYIQLDKIIKQDTDKIKIINFWATWCKPCVKEIPHFEELLKKYSDENIEIIMVSFDFVEELDKKVIPFVKKKGMKSRVVLLDETDYNAFIDKVDKNWSGAIPATLMLDYRNDKRAFFEKEFKGDELEQAYLTFIKQVNP